MNPTGPDPSVQNDNELPFVRPTLARNVPLHTGNPVLPPRVNPTIQNGNGGGSNQTTGRGNRGVQNQPTRRRTAGARPRPKHGPGRPRRDQEDLFDDGPRQHPKNKGFSEKAGTDIPPRGHETYLDRNDVTKMQPVVFMHPCPTTWQ